MEIYVQSCGVAQEHDYRWLKIPEEGQAYREIPRILRQASRIENGSKVRLTDMYESQEPSIVMARDNGELLLLITALEAMERTKVYGRQVRNSVAWVTQDSEVNKKIASKVAAYAKENWENLRKIVDEAVDFDDKDGFRVNREPLEKYIEDAANINRQDDSIKISSVEPKIDLVYWQTVNPRNIKLTIFLATVIFIALVSVIVLTAQFIIGSYLQEPPQQQQPSPSLIK